MEEVERANEAQLHSILSELTNTTYFRLFQVDLKRTCKFWGGMRRGGRGSGERRRAVVFGAEIAVREVAADGSSAISEPPKTMCSLDLEHKDGVGAMFRSPLTDSVDRTISTPRRAR